MLVQHNHTNTDGSIYTVAYNSAVARPPEMPSNVRPSVLVLTLYSGEAEFGRCRNSLENQSYTSWEHRLFEGLPNAEAHARLYQTVMAERGNHDLFLKLDADMILADREVLADLVQVFERRPRLDHLVFAVTDWMTESQIIGAHLFSNRVHWNKHRETLYVDPDPEFPGEKVMVMNPPRDLVLHASDPSPLQAFHFGAHRALQASQAYRGLLDSRPHDARIQWQYLDRVWRHFERTGDSRLGLAMLAADMVFRRELPATASEYSDPALITAFEHVSKIEGPDILARLEQRWATSAKRNRTWRRALGPTRFSLVVGRSLRDAAATAVKAACGWSRDSVQIGSRA
jgi:hypothetical protein